MYKETKYAILQTTLTNMVPIKNATIPDAVPVMYVRAATPMAMAIPRNNKNHAKCNLFGELFNFASEIQIFKLTYIITQV